MYKMIALDLDGTLNNDEKKITDKTREALLAVQQHGVTVVLASGRQAPGLSREADALDLKDYHGLLLSYNGGRIQDATFGPNPAFASAAKFFHPQPNRWQQ